MPFGTDPCDLNLDLYCTELLCECEAILERLPEGDDDEGGVTVYDRSIEQVEMDYGADDGDDERERERKVALIAVTVIRLVVRDLQQLYTIVGSLMNLMTQS
ncbi:hypothetical protein IAR55_002939 [Kwoniella newhampshirensis]|uniref:Uncharacterized protein n=1 Tax=Kwoniella newhampshirensis TaxID=1651941 RepID=A0AAW0YXY7_9TREE